MVQSRSVSQNLLQHVWTYNVHTLHVRLTALMFILHLYLFVIAFIYWNAHFKYLKSIVVFIRILKVWFKTTSCAKHVCLAYLFFILHDWRKGRSEMGIEELLLSFFTESPKYRKRGEHGNAISHLLTWVFELICQLKSEFCTNMIHIHT